MPIVRIPVARILVSSILFTTLFTFAANSALAQLQSSPYSAKGRIISVTEGLITVQVAGGKQVKIKVLKQGEEQIQINEKGKMYNMKGATLDLAITAHYTPAQIIKGGFVQFLAHLDDKGFSKADVTQITILDPSQGGKLGVFEDGGGDDTDAPSGTTAYLVKGKTTSTVKRGGKLTVTVPKGKATPRGKISITIPDDATVTAYSEKLEHARKGDEIEIEGKKFTTDIVGEKIVITRYAPGVKRKPSDVAKDDKKPAADKDDDSDKDDGSDKTADDDKRKKPGRVVIIN